MEFLGYYEEHDIIPFGLPPHTTHLLQPLDVAVFQPMKHYHSRAVDMAVRDGCTNFTKLEFLEAIQEVRLQTFKESTIKSAFKKTGIVPYNPLVVLREIEARRPRTPEEPQTPSRRRRPEDSSPFSTPLTVRKLYRVSDRILDAAIEELDPDSPLYEALQRYIKGSEVQAYELIQIRRDFGRIKAAEEARRRRRIEKNVQLQSRGVLTIHDRRSIVQRKEEDALAKAMRVVAAAEEKAKKIVQRGYLKAAKKGRKLRLQGILKPLEVTDEKGYRLLKKG